jgi:hypothetical protein
MAVANAVFYVATFVLAARALPAATTGWSRVGAGWAAAYAAGLATKAPRSAAILTLMPAVGKALSWASGGDAGKAMRLAVAIAVTALVTVLAVLTAVAVV